MCCNQLGGNTELNTYNGATRSLGVYSQNCIIYVTEEIYKFLIFHITINSLEQMFLNV